MKFCLCISAAALLLGPTAAFGQTITGHTADQFIAGPVDSEPQDGNGTSLGNPGGHTLKIGTVGPFDPATSGRVPVFVFRLPDFGATADPFTAASLSFGTAGKNANTTVNTDLYGLARRDAAPGVLTTDYYLGDLDETDATLLEDDILTPESAPNTIYTTDESGSAALASYLNAQYDGGAGSRLYIYLRLNVDGPMTNVTGYNTYTANDDVVENRPVITYTSTVAARNADFDGNGAVDGVDFLAWQRNLGTASGATPEQGDANGDGAINGNDLDVWKSQFGAAALSAAAQAVPEPGVFALALLAAAACRAAVRSETSRSAEGGKGDM